MVLINTTVSQQDYYCDQPVDVAVLVDSSIYFGAEDFAELKTFAKSFTTFFQLDRNGLAPFIGFLPYSDRVHETKMINFRYSTRATRLTRKIDKLDFDGGRGTRMDLVLRYARESLFSANKGSRSWVPHVVLAITGSARYWDVSLKEAMKGQARALRAQGIKLLVASVGQSNAADFESMVASKDNVFLVRYPYGLLQVAEKMVRKICPTPSTFGCPGKVDIAFIVDSSGSISNKDYNKMKYFMFSIAKALNISENGAHAGVVVYSKYAEVAIKFSDFKDVSGFQKAVYKLPHMNSLTRIDLGLKIAYSQLFSSLYGGARRDVKKLAVILTDGKQSSTDGVKESVAEAAKPLINSGIKTLSIGIGADVDKDELRAMVEYEEDVITAVNFDELLRKIQDISQLTCEQLKPSVCEESIDLAFVLDSSGSISMDEFNEAKKFVENLAKMFTISLEKTRVALMIYSDQPQITSRFGKIKSGNDLSNDLNSLPHLRGKTRIDLALKLAGNKLFTGDGGMRLPSSVIKVAIVITDGRQSPAADAMRLDEAAADLLVRGVKVLSIGIGDKVDRFELNMMVLNPEKHVFMSKTYSALQAQLMKITREICSR